MRSRKLCIKSIIYYCKVQVIESNSYCDIAPQVCCLRETHVNAFSSVQ